MDLVRDRGDRHPGRRPGSAPWSGPKGYVAAVLAVGLSVLLRFALTPFLAEARPYLTLFGGVALASWLSRWRPASLAAILGFVEARFFFAKAESASVLSFSIAEFAGYALSAGFIIFFGEMLHRSRSRAETQHEELRVTLSSIGDAVITTDGEGRVSGMNPVAEALTGWNSGDAEGKPLETVFRIVNETTKQPAENPALRALREGTIVGLANHTVLIRKDGTECPIDDSAAPIKDARGVLFGCALVFRDVTIRRRAERELWESREELRITLGSIGDGVIVADAGGRVRSLNAEAERLTGWKDGDATGRPLAEVFRIVNEATRVPVENPVEKVLRKGTVVGLANHTVLLSRDGRTTPIDDSAAPIREAGGPLHGVVMVFRDVTKERQAQHARARLASIVESSGDAIFTKNLDGVVQTWNASAEQLFGYAPEEIIGRPITLIIPPERLHEEDEILGRIRAGKTVERLETVRVAKGGRRIPVQISVSPLRDADGNVTGASKIIHDITEIVAAREALSREREVLATTLSSIGDAVIVTDTKGSITFMNPEAERLTAWKSADARGRQLTSVFRIVNEESRQPVENPVEKVLRLGTVVGLANHTLLVPREGPELPIDDSAAPIRQGNGELFGVVVVFRDFTQRRAGEQALKDADRRKDEFLAVLSHELRNPLAPIRMAVGMLRQVGPPTPQLQDLREIIERQTSQLVRLLDDLLDVSRIASGKIVLRKDRVSLALAVSTAIESVRPLIDSRGHDLLVHLPDEPLHVYGDVTRLAQIIANLLSNASKYTERGGRIALTVSREDGSALVRVRDSGIGLAPEQISKIFVMFAQVDPSLERGQGGLGVGLALSKSLVELHGGSIEVKSEGLGRGSEFIVRLPILSTTASAGGERESSRSGSAPQVRRRVLVADDNVDSAKMLTTVLRLAGHDVRVAHDGVSALELAGEFAAEVAFLDIGMPKMNGYDLARELRARLGKSVVLVALTGWGKDEDRRRAAAAGFDHHFTKPVALETIEAFFASPVDAS